MKAIESIGFGLSMIGAVLFLFCGAKYHCGTATPATNTLFFVGIVLAIIGAVLLNYNPRRKS